MITSDIWSSFSTTMNRIAVVPYGVLGKSVELNGKSVQVGADPSTLESCCIVDAGLFPTPHP